MKEKGLIILGVAVAFLGVFFVTGLVLPADYEVSRSRMINAPPTEVFEQVNDLRKSEQWSPWRAADPSIVFEYGGKTVGEGASYTWKGASGSGKYRIVRSDPPWEINTLLESPDMGERHGRWSFEPAVEGVVVTWSYRGKASGMGAGYVALAMDSLVGPFFEDGLERLAGACEGEGP